MAYCIVVLWYCGISRRLDGISDGRTDDVSEYSMDQPLNAQGN